MAIKPLFGEGISHWPLELLPQATMESSAKVVWAQKVAITHTITANTLAFFIFLSSSKMHYGFSTFSAHNKPVDSQPIFSFSRLIFLWALGLLRPSHLFRPRHICPAHIGLQPIRRSFIRGASLGIIMADAYGGCKKKPVFSCRFSPFLCALGLSATEVFFARSADSCLRRNDSEQGALCRLLASPSPASSAV